MVPSHLIHHPSQSHPPLRPELMVVAVDLVVFASHVIPVVPRDVVLENHAVVVQAGRIVDVLPREQVAAKYAAAQTKDLQEHILIPGLVNTHTHSPLTLIRGISDDKPLCDWLNEDIWPAEAQFVSPAFVKDGMTHAAAEMIRSGTTCINDMFYYPQDIADVMETIGMRAAIGLVVMEFPSNYASNAQEYLDKALPLLEKYKSHDLITVTVAPHAPYTVSEESMAKVEALSKQHGVKINIHMHETEAECHDSEHQVKDSTSCHQSDQKLRPLANFKRLGLLSDRMICVHMTQLTDQEIQDVAEAGASVVHCPTSNLKLVAGICRVTSLLEKGVNVALGTDSVASNNSLNMFAEMKLAAILAKAESKTATSVPASMALQMATLNGARAIGLGDQIGSIEVGKRADLVAVACDNIELLPMYNAISHVVYVAGREHVSDVWINGKHVLDERKLTTIDEAQVKTNVRSWNEDVRSFHSAINKQNSK